MVRNILAVLLLGTVVCFLHFVSSAAVPYMINYQGKLTTASGGCLNDTIQMTFSIYPDTMGSPADWSETQSEVVVKEGIFNVLLGSVDSIPAEVFEGSVKYLGVQVESDAEMTPLKPMVSVAYAYRSVESDTAEFAYSGAPDDDWDIDTAGLNVYRLTGNVGIGMPSPQEKLDVEGTAQVTGFKMPTDAVNNYVLTSDATGVGTWQPAVGGADMDWNLSLSDSNDTTLTTGGAWGIARYGNTLYGNADSTHINLGVACTTGTNGQNYKYCTVGGGDHNAASNSWATVGGGASNTAGGFEATVGGGFVNVATGFRSTVGGGYDNSASDSSATVSGGTNNEANGRYAVVSGGKDNSAGSSYAVIGGGFDNTASGDSSTVGGGTHNAAAAGAATVGGGAGNVANADRATVSGGAYNNANDFAAVIGGGTYNVAAVFGATVSGGVGNLSGDSAATVGGGSYNKAWGKYSVVSGGGGGSAFDSNSALGQRSVIGGGFRNTASNDFSIVAGGGGNISSGIYSTIGGGFNNKADQFGSTVGGGGGNYATGNMAIIGGGDNNTAIGVFSTIAGGYGNFTQDTAGTVGGGRNNNARGKYSFVGGGGGADFADSNSAIGEYSSISGGRSNAANGSGATVGGGLSNTASNGHAIVAGGELNTASGSHSSVGGGQNNEAGNLGSTVTGGVGNYASGSMAAIGGGNNNSASGRWSAIAGGVENTADDTAATVGGGYDNLAGGGYSTVPGGYLNEATGNYSFAAGRQALAVTNNTFVWNDGSTGYFSSSGAGQFLIGAGGGVGIGTSTPGTSALKVTNDFTGSFSQMVYLQSVTDPSVNNDVLAVDVPSTALDGIQFIECARGSDNEFKVNGDGNVYADGAYNTPASDYAEMIRVSSGASTVGPGDVMVIDPDNPRSVRKASGLRSTLVAGIYSTKPGFIGSERDWDKPTGQGELGTYTLRDLATDFDEIPLAVVGIVPCKVSAENGSIRPGDLLVTSGTPGHAMRDDNPTVGTVVGKALGSLSSGTGVIKVLVTLH